MQYKLLLPAMALISAGASLAQSPNPYQKYVAPTVGPWERYGGQPSGTEIKPALIPVAFRGEWNDPIKDCGTGISDMRLRIGPKSVRFYESEGEVRRVIRHNSRAVTVLASYSGEGQVWDRIDRLVLSSSGNELTIQTGQDSATRYRCPLKKARR
jgi:hypothetical protein